MLVHGVPSTDSAPMQIARTLASGAGSPGSKLSASSKHPAAAPPAVTVQPNSTPRLREPPPSVHSQLAATATRPDAVFLDIGLPDPSGYEVALRLRALPALRRTLLVALTGWGTQEDRARSRASGFDRHLTKPAELAAVEELLREAEARKAAPPAP